MCHETWVTVTSRASRRFPCASPQQWGTKGTWGISWNFWRGEDEHVPQVTCGRKPSLECPALGAASAGISQNVQLPHRNLPHHQPHPRTGQRETLIGPMEGTWAFGVAHLGMVNPRHSRSLPQRQAGMAGGCTKRMFGCLGRWKQQPRCPWRKKGCEGQGLPWHLCPAGREQQHHPLGLWAGQCLSRNSILSLLSEECLASC